MQLSRISPFPAHWPASSINYSLQKKKRKKKLYSKYFWYYNVYILIVKYFIPTKIWVANHFER